MTTCKNSSCGCGPGAAVSVAPSDVSGGVTPSRIVLRIDKMDCPTEEGLIRQRLERLPQIVSLDFNLLQRMLAVTHTFPTAEPIVAALRELGMPPATESMPTSAQRTTVYRIENMDCPTEEALIRNKLGGMAGIAALDFNLMQRRLTVRHLLDDTAPVEAALRAIGMRAVVEASQDMPTEEPSRPAVPGKQWWLMGMAGIAAAAAIALATGSDASPAVIVLAVLAIATGGLDTYKKGRIALKNRNLNMTALMSIAVTGAVLIGQWPEAAMVMFLFALAELIEVLSLDRARNAIRSLMALTPDKATVRQADGNWVEIEAVQATVGMLARVRPGERIPLDGEVVSGQSSVNQAPITGESMPAAKTAGDPVFAGTINETGSFEYRVTQEATHSILARIIKAVEEAQGSRAPTQRFVDQFARVYTPAVFGIALLVAVLPPLAFGQPWMDWIYKALVMLVIACPCALVISTPVTVVSGLAAAARRGILIKGGAYLEEGRKLKVLALDKTGTITQGKPTVTDVVALHGNAQDALHFAASLAIRSDHPVSSAVAAHWQAQGGGQALVECRSV